MNKQYFEQLYEFKKNINKANMNYKCACNFAPSTEQNEIWELQLTFLLFKSWASYIYLNLYKQIF